ncbi:MAG: PorP/SprF family type IX secretion system membrane protein [Bacteroidales bacterium]|jgi:type IX secretion system PorP/SprF family membrane protein|nr:PorP/SprF family type IX secretion system membrane protein [Bacteroidales bacterium]
MTRKYSILFYVLLQIFAMQLCSQDPVMSHYYANSLQLNPSLAGVEGPARVYVGYRNQWPSSGNSFVTYQTTYDQYIDKLHGGLGVRVLNDRQGNGIFNAYNLDVMYAYHLNASRKLSFSGALQAGIGQRSFHPGSLVFGDMIDPLTGGFNAGATSENPLSPGNKFYPDFATGFSAFYTIFYGGVSVHHLLSPVVSELPEGNRLPRKYTAHVGAVISIKERRRGQELMKLSPNLVFIQQLRTQQLAYGLDMIYEDFLLGIWTRHDLFFNYGDLIFTAGYSANNLRFRYSYDVKLSSPTIRLPNMGAHEISLLITYENLNKRNKHRTIKCPKF